MAIAERLSESIRPFAALRRGDVAFAGGKGANRGELTAAGIPVPPGFVVGAPAYAAFCDAGGLRARLDSLLASLDTDDAVALAAASESARGLVLAEPVPDQLARAIRDAYAAANPGNETVAVRSSATSEDTRRPRSPE